MSQDDGRPAGGTARTSGNRTPARVHWAGERSFQGLTEIYATDYALPFNPEQSDMQTHALDEHGRNPEALRSLTDALQRHRSASQTRDGRTRMPMIQIPSPSHSPPHQHQADSMPHVLDNVTDSTFTSPSSTAPPSPTQDRTLPGELYIAPEETHGLPGAGVSTNKFEKTARNIVRSHTRTKKGLKMLTPSGLSRSHVTRPNLDIPKASKSSMRFRNPLGSVGIHIPFMTSKTAEKASGRSFDINLADVEAIGNPSPAPKLGGGGILSTLLTLYDNEHAQMSGSSTPATATTSPADSSCSEAEGEAKTRHSLVLKRWKRHVPHLPSFHGNQQTQSTAIGSLVSTSAAAAALPPVPYQGTQQPGLSRNTFSLDINLPKYRKTTSQHSRATPFYRRSSGDTDDEYATTAANTSANRSRSNSLDALDNEKRQSWADAIKHHANGSMQSLKSLGYGYGKGKHGSESGKSLDWEEREKYLLREHEKREKRRKKRKREAFITRHVADIIQRQEFILKLVRAFMMFGAPSHRLVAQIQATGNVLSIELSCMYLPDIVLISFDDNSTGTSNLKFIRQASSLDLGKLHLAYGLYWRVIHDELIVSEASKELDVIMRSPPVYKLWQLVLIGGVCSTAISIVSFGGSFIDGLISFPLGALLVAIQLLSAKNELYSNVFEITVALLLSFLSAALASTQKFCYPAVTSGAVVLILPGYITLVGALELNSRSIVSGAVRIGYALIYSLFLGFGLAIGAEIYEKAFNTRIYGADDFQCVLTHGGDAPWYRRTPSLTWAALLVPLYSCALSMRNHQPWNRKELYLSILIAGIGWITNHFVSLNFPNQSDISAAVGAAAVGVVANLYGRFAKSGHGNAFVVMITGIMFQLPSGLGPTGLLAFASQQTSGTSDAYISGFKTALQLISVGIGLTVGLSISLVIVHPFQSKKRGSGVFSL